MRWSLLLVALWVGCAPADGLEGGALPVRLEPDTSVDPPAPPVAPALPSFLPCPQGWAAVPAAAGDAPVICEPWAAEVPAPACGPGEARFVDTGACTPVGAPCSTDEWATGLPTAGVRYVKAGAAAGGSGSRAAPFATVAQALLGAAPGTVIALSKGTFVEDVRLVPGVVLWGACPAQTVLQGAGGNVAVRAGGLGAVLKNLRVTSPTLGVLVNPSGNDLQLEDVIIDGAHGVALLVGNTARVTGRNVVIRNTEASASGSGGRGITCEFGGHVTIDRAVFENNRENAVNVNGASSRVSLKDAVLRATRPRTDGLMGRAGSVNGGGALELIRALVERNSELSLLAGPGSSLSLTDVLIRDTQSPAGDDGLGVVLEGATGTWRRVALVRNSGIAVQVRSASRLDAQHLVIANTREDAAGRDGVGLDVIEGSDVTLERAAVVGSATGGLGVKASTAMLRDVLIVDTRASRAVPDLASALQVARGAVVTADRLEVRRSQGVGVLVDGPMSRLLAGDLLVRDGQPFAAAVGGGGGLAVQSGANATVQRLRVEGGRAVGVLVTDAMSTARLDDVAVLDTASDEVDGTSGRALHVQGGADVSLSRAALERARDVGLFVTAATVSASNLSVRDVTKRACTAAGRCDDVGGSAVVVLDPAARFSATRFRLDGSAQCGLQLASQADAALSRGAVRGHAIGVCLQVPGFDVAKLQDQVVYERNGRNLDAQDVPLPAVTIPRYGAR